MKDLIKPIAIKTFGSHEQSPKYFPLSQESKKCFKPFKKTSLKRIRISLKVNKQQTSFKESDKYKLSFSVSKGKLPRVLYDFSDDQLKRFKTENGTS